MAISPKQASIFVSHTWADNEWCEKFVEILRRAGADVWWDVGGLRHGLIAVEVSEQIEERPIFITVLSPTALTRPWVKTEYSMAVTKYHQRPDERIVLPVVAKKCEIPLILKAFRGIVGEGDLAPEQAAEETITALNIVSPRRPKAPRRAKPKTADEAITQGKALLVQRRPQEALTLFETALTIAQAEKEVTQIGNAHLGRGRSLHDLERYKEALEAFKDAMQVDPNNAQGWAGYGGLLGELGQYEEALPNLDRAVELKPDYIAAWLNRSTVLRHMNEPNKALESAEHALHIDPNNGPALMLKADALEDLHQLDAALAAYDAALAMPDTPKATFR